MRRRSTTESILRAPGRALAAGKVVGSRALQHMPGISNKPERFWERPGLQKAAAIGAAAIGLAAATAYALRRRIGSEQPASREWQATDGIHAAGHPPLDGATPTAPPVGEARQSSLM